MTLPNLLTMSRVGLIPVLVMVFYWPEAWAHPVAAIIFSVAALTDLLDGWLARRLKQESPFGAFLDPVADKLLVSAALVLLIEQYANPLITLPGLLIMGREITVSALREWMAGQGRGAELAVRGIGKWKTGLQMVAIALLLLSSSTPTNLMLSAPLAAGVMLQLLAVVALYIAALLALLSLAVYLRVASRGGGLG